MRAEPAELADGRVFNDTLLAFLQRATTPFHAVQTMSETLAQAGFVRLFEGDAWQLEPDGRYFLTRNGSSLIAFTTGAGKLAEQGIRMVGAHTDSPCLQIKPQPELIRHGYLQLGVEVYGGALLNPWFDRDLSVAGRLSYVDAVEQVRSALIDFRDPIAVIPSLAIHLDREVNASRSINAQSDLPPVLLQISDGAQPEFRDLLLQRLRTEYAGIDAERVLDYELNLYDTQPAALVGLNKEFIAGARLDNLLSCFIGLAAIRDVDAKRPCLLVCNDHEEVGSMSAAGAQGTFLRSVLERMCGSLEAFNRAMDRSMLISVDNAHGIHPNFADKHDDNHGPLLNHGPVIKVNANQRYASNSETAALFRQLCRGAEVPVQAFVVRSDMACGSTIGPLTASEIGVRTLDVGVPTFAMHSIRELAGAYDAWHLLQGLQRFFRVHDRHAGG